MDCQYPQIDPLAFGEKVLLTNVAWHTLLSRTHGEAEEAKIECLAGRHDKPEWLAAIKEVKLWKERSPQYLSKVQ
jgi:hypothetical protein